jgi:hypothetical protein
VVRSPSEARLVVLFVCAWCGSSEEMFRKQAELWALKGGVRVFCFKGSVCSRKGRRFQVDTGAADDVLPTDLTRKSRNLFDESSLLLNVSPTLSSGLFADS